MPISSVHEQVYNRFYPRNKGVQFAWYVCTVLHRTWYSFQWLHSLRSRLVSRAVNSFLLIAVLLAPGFVAAPQLRPC